MPVGEGFYTDGSIMSTTNDIFFINVYRVLY